MGIQKVSWRERRATDYRAVQGAVAADGFGNLLSGLFATVPNTTYSSSVSVVEITGIASRRVGVCIGLIFCVLAFLPKVTQLLLVIPDPVLGAYAMVIIAVLFMLGTRIVLQKIHRFVEDFAGRRGLDLGTAPQVRGHRCRDREGRSDGIAGATACLRLAIRAGRPRFSPIRHSRPPRFRAMKAP